MSSTIKSISPYSPASRTIINPGDSLIKINGHSISDILDYKFYSYDSNLFLELSSAANGKLKFVKLRKPEGTELGLVFDSPLMDKKRSCANNCIFCFINQLPPGMRSTLYYKDDDFRLSFFQGNYVTLTNLSPSDIERIIKLRISPINISVHTLNPVLRRFMLRNNNAGNAASIIQRFADAGITMNCQIVCCPDFNDGSQLDFTMRGLAKLAPHVASASVVPVGLTKFRDGLTPLSPFDRNSALNTVRQVEKFGRSCLNKFGSRLFFCADELYIKAGLNLPPDKFYENYPQLENGVGMMRLFITQFMDELSRISPISRPTQKSSIATGTAASKYLSNLLCTAGEKYGRIDSTVYAINNDFFGNSITVSGLITGRDIINQLSNKNLGDRLLIPKNMLRADSDLFLDNLTVSDVSNALRIPIRIVEQNGTDFLHALLGE